MAQQTDDLRDRLLAALPQPENLANYREATATLLAKHAKALRWEKYTANMLAWLAVGLVFLWNQGPWRLSTSANTWLQVMSAVFFFMGVIYTVRYKVYESQIATLKEIKQVQLQILELQASLRKEQ